VSTSHTILLVEDEEGLADLYAIWLADEYEVRTVYSGEAALECVDKDVDPILLDRRMPSLSGDEVLAELRDRGYDCPVAMVSAVTPEFEIAKMPFDAYLCKPIEREQIQEAVARLVMLAESDELSRDAFAVAEKMAVLEAETTPEDRNNSSAFADLSERMDEIRDESADPIEEIDLETLSGTVSGRSHSQ